MDGNGVVHQGKNPFNVAVNGLKVTLRGCRNAVFGRGPPLLNRSDDSAELIASVT